MPPRVTIGVPFFQNRATLAQALRSIFAQTFTAWELVLVDDGGDDGSLEIARAVGDPRVRVVSDGAHRTLPFRLNQIVSLARAELVARMDADDLMHPERLARQIALLDARPEVDAVGTGMYAIDEAGRLMGVIPPRALAARPVDVLTKGILAHGTIVGRRAWFEAHPYDVRYPRAEDRDLWCRTYRDSTFAALPDLLYFVRYPAAPDETLRKYVASCRDNRALYRAHGPAMAGWPATGRAIAESYAKELVYRVLSEVGWQERLLRRRSRPADAREAEAARDALRVIDDARVSGLERAATLGA